MTTEDELLQFGLAWDQAMVRNNTDEIGKFMSDEWIIVSTDSGIISKSAFLSHISCGDLVHHRMDSDETNIKIYGNTGIVKPRNQCGEL